MQSANVFAHALALQQLIAVRYINGHSEREALNVNHDVLVPLLQKLESVARITEDDKALLRKLRITTKHLEAGEDLVAVGDRPQFSALLVGGMLCRYNLVEGSKRQIMSFHLPGDIPDLQSVFLKRMDHSLGALSPSTVGLIPHEDLRELFKRSHNVATVMWRETLIDAAIFRQWIGNAGGRTAVGAMAHLICELFTRAISIGLIANDLVFKMALTQQDVADALGLSLVHVNRTLKHMRETELLVWEQGALTVLNWQRLKEVGDFDPDYLHLTKR